VKDVLRAALRDAPAALQPRNVLREYLQARVLGVLQAEGAFVPLAFVGGTALRFVYGLPRFSEDLDFSLERPQGGYEPERYADALLGTFRLEGYDVAVRSRLETTIDRIDVRWSGLMYELGLSPHPDETFTVRVETDTRPPEGAGLEVTSVMRHRPLRIQHHDRASLMAGKVAALLTGDWVKGRDVYDLVWYLSDAGQPPPNAGLLRSALEQWGHGDVGERAERWASVVGERLEAADWPAVQRDVSPLLERREDVALLDREAVFALLARVAGKE